jgi:hypothetical protein
MKNTMCYCSKGNLGVIFALAVILWMPLSQAGQFNQNSNVGHYKMLSTIEYSGQGQFKHQVETLFTVRKETLMDDKQRYFISSRDIDFSGGGSSYDQQPLLHELSFIIDGKSDRISAVGRELTILERVHNHCVDSGEKPTQENIGKTWKQSYDLSSFDYSLPKNLTFTMTAINVSTKVYGRLIAVRALSEPFIIKVVKANEGIKDVKSRMRSVYLFDSKLEEIFISISVFEASADIESSNETLRCEVATYKTDADGLSVNLDGLDNDFENFVRKVGLTSRTLEVTKAASLPNWVQSEGILALQMSDICAATACEGALNPVATICLPAARTIALQSHGQLVSAGQVGSIGTILAKSIPAMGSMKLAFAPPFMGLGLGTEIAIAGASVGTVAIAGGFDSDGHEYRSPSVP